MSNIEVHLGDRDGRQLQEAVTLEFTMASAEPLYVTLMAAEVFALANDLVHFLNERARSLGETPLERCKREVWLKSLMKLRGRRAR